MERNLTEQKVVLKVLTALVKRLKKKVFLLLDKHRLIQKTFEELMKKYNEKNTIIGISGRKLVKTVGMVFIQIKTPISSAILDFFEKYLNWTTSTNRPVEIGQDVLSKIFGALLT